jgi:hypothetical protein
VIDKIDPWDGTEYVRLGCMIITAGEAVYVAWSIRILFSFPGNVFFLSDSPRFAWLAIAHPPAVSRCVK